MPTNTHIRTITMADDGGVTLAVGQYIGTYYLTTTGTLTLSGGWTITHSGTPKIGDTFTILYDGALAGAQVVTILGATLPVEYQIIKWKCIAKWDGAWDVIFIPNFDQDNIILSGHIVSDAVTTAKILDDNVTLAKLASSEFTRGDLLYGDASGDPAVLTVGTSAQILQSDGTDTSWVTVSGDVTITAGGAVTIANTAVENTMINTNVVGNGLTGGAGSAISVLIDTVSGTSISSSANGIRLTNDNAAPGVDYFYGTNGAGTKGWYSQSSIGITLQTAFDAGNTITSTSNSLVFTQNNASADAIQIAGTTSGDYIQITSSATGRPLNVQSIAHTGTYAGSYIYTTANVSNIDNLITNYYSFITPSTAAASGESLYGFYSVASDAVGNADGSYYGTYYSSIVSYATGRSDLYGLNIQITGTRSTADNIIGVNINADSFTQNTSASANLYGVYMDTSSMTHTTGSVYGGYYDLSQTTTSTQNTYGSYYKLNTYGIGIHIEKTIAPSIYSDASIECRATSSGTSGTSVSITSYFIESATDTGEYTNIVAYHTSKEGSVVDVKNFKSRLDSFGSEVVTGASTYTHYLAEEPSSTGYRINNASCKLYGFRYNSYMYSHTDGNRYGLHTTFTGAPSSGNTYGVYITGDVTKAIYIDQNIAGTVIEIDQDANSATDMYGLAMNLTNAGAGVEFAFSFAGSEASYSAGHYTTIGDIDGYITISIAGNTLYIPAYSSLTA